MSDTNGSVSSDFEQAFRVMRAAAKLCMGLVETGNTDPNTSEKTLWAGVDAIIEDASRDVKAIWKRRYMPQEDVVVKGRSNHNHMKVNGSK